MNGLLTIFEKQDTNSTKLKHLLNKGLESLSHRGKKICASFLMNKNLQSVSSDETPAQIIMGACSSHNNESHIASHNGNILFFEGRLINRNELCQQLSLPEIEDISDAEIVFRMLENSGTNCLKTLKGFWSLIYFDHKNRSVYGARDHFGNRPLYFCNTSNQFALASESRTL